MKKQLLTLIFLSLFFTTTSRGNHFASGDISYSYLSGTKYKITIRIYRDCRGNSLASIPYGAYAGNNGSNATGTTALSCTRVKITDVSPVCSTQSKPCNPTNTSGSGEGFEEHIYLDTIDISQQPFSGYISQGYCEISLFVGALNTLTKAITTGPSGSYYIQTRINICNIQKCKNQTNNSLFWANYNIDNGCCNQALIRNYKGTEPDGDYIIYKLDAGLQGLPNTKLTFSTPFTDQYPVTPYCVPPTTIKCTPNLNTNPPRGFYFDTLTAQMAFTATKCDEVSFVGITAYEYRMDTTGKMILISTQHRDILIVVKDDCGYNKSPDININKNNISLCEGDSVSVHINIYDEIFKPYQIFADSLSVSLDTTQIPGSYTRNFVDTPKYKKDYVFTWRTKKGQARLTPYSVIFTASDNHCPKPAITQKLLSIYVKLRKGDSAWMQISADKCGSMKFKGFNKKGPNPFFYWQIFDSVSQQLVCTGSGQTWTSCPLNAGGYKVRCIYLSDAYCTDTIYGNFHNYTPKPTADLGNDTTLCLNSQFTLAPTILNAGKIKKYKWEVNGFHNKKDTFSTFNANANYKFPYKLAANIEDNQGCIFNTDTIKISVFANDSNIKSQSYFMCEGQKIQIGKSFNSAQTYSWFNGDTSTFIEINKGGTYTCNVSSISGCKYSVNHIVTEQKKPYKFSPIKHLCENFTNLNLNSLIDVNGSNPSPGEYSFTGDSLAAGSYIFSNKNKMGNYNIAFSKNVNGCLFSDTIKISVHPYPVAAFTTDPLFKTELKNPVFQMINQTTYAGADIISYKWNFGRSLKDTSSAKNPSVTYSNIGPYFINMVATNGYGCSSSTSLTVNVTSGLDVLKDLGLSITSDLKIVGSEIKSIQLTLYNAQGQIVYKANNNLGIGHLGLPNGVYTYSISGQTASYQNFNIQGKTIQ